MIDMRTIHAAIARCEDIKKRLPELIAQADEDLSDLHPFNVALHFCHAAAAALGQADRHNQKQQAEFRRAFDYLAAACLSGGKESRALRLQFDRLPVECGGVMCPDTAASEVGLALQQMLRQVRGAANDGLNELAERARSALEVKEWLRECGFDRDAHN